MKTPPPNNSIRGRFAQVKTLALSAGLMASIAAAFGQTFWSGGTSDFNVPASWSGAYIGGTPNCANDSGSNNVVLIQPGDAIWQHGDTLAGNGNNTSGKYLQTGSTNNTGGGNWLRMGIGSGSYGYYVLSNGVVNVGGRTQLGENGNGYLEIDGGVYNGNVNDGGANPAMVCGQGDFGPGTGTLVINGGTVTYGRETWIGQKGGSTGTGYLFLNGGILNVNDWFVFGRGGGASGAQGYGVMTGGTLNFTGGGRFLIGGGGVGSLAQSGGTINAFNQYLVPESDGGSGGSGTNILSGNAVLNAHNWIAVGRNGGHGEMDISGSAALTRDNSADGGSHFDIGGGGPGVLNQNGGAITNTTSDFWLGENAAAVWNFNAGTAVLGNVVMCVNNSASGVLNLNGGLFQTAGIASPSSGAVSELFLNGATLQANANNLNFISGLTIASVGPATSVIDSQGFNITIPQVLGDNGGGSITKVGSGTLTLTGANGYTGSTAVSAGKLITTTASTGAGNYSVADGAELDVTVQSLNAQLNVANLTLGTSTGASLGLNLGGFGNPASAPINVSGTLTKHGVITVNISDSLPQIGQFPLISFAATGGSGSYVLGAFPVGVGAYLSNNVSSLDLVITNVNLPRWDGSVNGNWDISLTANWINIGTGLPTTYSDGNAVLFDDQATGVTTVNLATTVHPVSVTFNNTGLPYSIVGTGKISGNAGINLQGAGTASILNTGGNNFTGPVVISGGVLAVTNLANGGSASAIGASSANSTNLVLNGGGLSYAGPAIVINRGYVTQQTNSSITTVSNLTLTGIVSATQFGGLTKTGNAQLSYKGIGTNVLSGSSSLGYSLQAGSVLFDGSGGGQTNLVRNGFSVVGATGAASVVITNATVTTTGDMSLGNVPSTAGTLTLNNGATLNVGSWFTLSDSAGSTGTCTLNSGSTLNVNNGRLFLCSNQGTTDTLNINGGTINKSGDYFAVVNGGWNGVGARTGVVNQVSGTVNSSSECWVGDAGGIGNGSLGIYNLSGGTLTVNNWFGIGRDGSTGIFNMSGGILNKGVGGDMVIGRGGSSGTFTMTGGTINKDNVNPILVGQGGGIGELDISGGTLNSAGEYWLGTDNGTVATNNLSGTGQMNIHNWVTIGRAGLGVVNMSGGQFNSDVNQFVVGIFGGGQGIWNQSSGALNVNQEIWIGQGDNNAHGTINLSGGSITNTSWLAIGREGGHGTLNISGGTMVKTGGGNISIAHNGGASGDVVISGTGTFLCLSGETWVGENAAPGTWTMNGGTAVLGLVHLAQNADAQGLMTLNGGSLTANEISTGNNGASQRELDFNGGTLVAGTDNSNFIHDLSAANIKSGGAIINTASHSVSVNQALLGVSPDGGLTKNGNGTLYLNGVSTYTNTTLANLGGIGGSGLIMAPLIVASGATLTPGAGGIGTFTVNNNVTLSAGSSTYMEVNKTSGTSDLLTGVNTLTYGGTLIVTNLGTSFVGGESYKLFNATNYSGSFSAISPATPGAGLTWNTSQLAVSGTISVIASTPLLSTSVSGGNLNVSWPTDHIGYTLQIQTNTLSVGLSSNWSAVPNSTTTNAVSIPLNPANPAVFLRLVP